MSEVNIPPFYVGQKVVALKTSVFKDVVKDKVYTVADCFLSQCCKVWKVMIAETSAPDDESICIKCGSPIPHKGQFKLIGNATYFAPVQENFQSITLEKVLEQETKLVGVN